VSLPLAVLSAVLFARLARELAEGELDPLDRAVSLAVYAARSPAFGWLMVLLSRLAGEVVMGSVGVAIAAALFVLRRRREAAFFALAAGGAVLLNLLLKTVFHRARPDEAFRIALSAPGFSFPSGHTMGSAAVLASVLVVLRAWGAPRWVLWPAGVLAAAFVVGVAVSRVYLGAHYPSDVAAGACGALAWVAVVAGWFYPSAVAGEGAG
jgi:undecaprenyl-diphosphatase